MIYTLLLLTLCNAAIGQTSVMSFNIRSKNRTDEPSWRERRESLVSKLSQDGAEIIALQEALRTQVKYIDSALKGYSWVGAGRDNGKRRGEYTPIFYREDRFSLKEWGTYWLSQSPSRPSIGWDARYKRAATWAIVESRHDGGELLIINTHFDHTGVVARSNSSRAVVELADSLCERYSLREVVLLGDFNVEVNDITLAPILDSFEYALLSSNHYWSVVSPSTFIGFPNKGSSEAVIDHIFIRNLKARSYEVDTLNYGLGFISDHRSIRCEVSPSKRVE